MSLKALFRPKSAALPIIESLSLAMGGGIAVEDSDGALLWGSPTHPGAARVSVRLNGAAAGQVAGTPQTAAAIASLLDHLLAKDAERRALAGEVLHLYREIHLIEQLSEQLAALLDIAAVGETALSQTRRLIAASSGVVLVRDSAEAPLREAARFGEAGRIDEWAAAIEGRGIAEITPEVLGAPLRANQRTVGVIALTSPAGYSSADLKLLNTIAMQTAAAMENALMCAEMVGAARDREQLAGLQRELETARTIQHSLVPRVFPPFPDRRDFDIHAQMTSAKAVGGDFFDFFLLDEHRLGVVIGDVSGKGVPAALYMAMTRTQIKTTALQGLSPSECLDEVNRVLVRDKVSTMFATCIYGILDTRSGEFVYSNAGHNPPFILRSDAAIEPLEMTGGLPLGILVTPKCAENTIRLSPGEGIFMYTDGVTEATNESLDDYTATRLETCLSQNQRNSARDLIDHVGSSLLEFTGAAPQSDDITMLALLRAGR